MWCSHDGTIRRTVRRTVQGCVRRLSAVCPASPGYVRRTVKVGRNTGPSGGRVRRTEGVAIIARDVMTYIVMT